MYLTLRASKHARALATRAASAFSEIVPAMPSSFSSPLNATRRALSDASTASRGADRYGASSGPMAGLLKALREHGGEMTTKELYERATANGAPLASMRHAKRLLKKMKEMDRVRTTAPVMDDAATGGGGRRRARGNFTYSITEHGLRRLEKLSM
ncbi:hypothetical protein BE221DRAFT_192167 [Ostreococcus tauri]|uniref:Uncharacterized protein n=1 Tax=Ostreococcus tauri TaxID=70448 RepID=A0A1Y5IC15_OSTTA|nr:hypothetical protein BE221DRAFT_192167 [Ostreococcus tauri]